MKKPPRPTHSYLTDTEVRTLDVLVRRGARALRPEECNKLISLFQHHVGDLQHARGVAGGLRQEMNRLRGNLRAAEDELQERRGIQWRLRAAWRSARRRAASVRAEYAERAAAVRELHSPSANWAWRAYGCDHENAHTELCKHCQTCYPCPTIAALTEPPQPRVRFLLRRGEHRPVGDAAPVDSYRAAR